MGITDGGDGTCGYSFSQDYKDSLRIIRSGENNSFYGKQHSDESKRKMREAKLLEIKVWNSQIKKNN